MVEENKLKDITIEKSEGDKNNYRLFTLDNELEVLLIQDNNQGATDAEEDTSEPIAYA